jgi:hypothetical protein
MFSFRALRAGKALNGARQAIKFNNSRSFFTSAATFGADHGHGSGSHSHANLAPENWDLRKSKKSFYKEILYPVAAFISYLYFFF